MYMLSILNNLLYICYINYQKYLFHNYTKFLINKKSASTIYAADFYKIT